ncbi:odorant receptor Or1-like [Zophobas morio]|uniref:odorant receptor Or1-like n=1 Tax=Zophobas morio TaxID=2755281 RepID=UPI003082FD47
MDEVHHDWKNTINLNILFLKVMGLWPRKNEVYKPGFYMVYCGIVVTLFVAWHIFTQVINIYFVGNNFESVVAIAYIILIEITAIFKVFFVIKNTKKLKERMALLKSNWFQKSNHEQKVLIESSIKFWKSVYRMFIAMSVSCNTFWLIYPLLDSSAEEKRLPFLAWYPYDYRISPLYEITYGFQVFSATYLTLVHLNVDNLMYTFNVYMKCQFDILSDNLRNFTKMSSDFNKSLIMCVLHHKRILRNLLIFVINVINPIKISAFNVFYLSLATFMTILKTAWSYFALLYQLSLRNK